MIQCYGMEKFVFYVFIIANDRNKLAYSFYTNKLDCWLLITYSLQHHSIILYVAVTWFPPSISAVSNIHTHHMEIGQLWGFFGWAPSARTTVKTCRVLVYKQISMLKFTSINTDFQTWFPIGWQQSHQPIGSHVRKSVLTSMDFNRDIN